MQELAKSFSQLVDSLNGGAKGLAEAMQRVVPDAWRIAVRQVVIDAACGLLAWSFVIVAIFSVSRILHNCGMKASDAKESIGPSEVLTDRAAWILWSRIIAGLAVMVSVIVVSHYLPTLLNPQYEAASQLSERFLGK